MRKILWLFVTAFLAANFASRAATIIVSTTNDTGAGSLRAALAAATGADTIDASSLTGAISLTTGELLVTNNVTITGSGPSSLTLDGIAASRVFTISNGVSVTISGLTITNGNASGNFPNNLGGGIFNDYSTLVVTNCVIAGNSADGGGGICNFGEAGSAILQIRSSTIGYNNASSLGGGIYNDGELGGTGTVSLTDSTLSHNSVVDKGGAIFTSGFQGKATVTITNSTISGNSAVNGGAVASDGSLGDAALFVGNSTFSGNSGTTGGGIYIFQFLGGSSTLKIGNTILNAGDSGANLTNETGAVTSFGYNLSSDDGGGVLTNANDILNTDPVLAPLLNYGGPTETHALLCGSPAIDAGDPAFSPPPITDQRGPGFDRLVNGRIDIGAFEVQTNEQTATRCSLEPSFATNLVGTTHTVIALVFTNFCPAADAEITFNILTGPNSGISGVETTSVSGTASFTYQGSNAGTDTVRAVVNSLALTCTATKVWIRVQPPGPCADLTGEWSNLIQTCKTNKTGVLCKVKGALLIQNLGTIDAPSSFVRYYLSDDGDTLGMQLKQQATGKVKPGKPKKRTLSAKLQANVNGSGKFIIAVVDADNSVDECDETNNTIVFGL